MPTALDPHLKSPTIPHLSQWSVMIVSPIYRQPIFKGKITLKLLTGIQRPCN